MTGHWGFHDFASIESKTFSDFVMADERLQLRYVITKTPIMQELFQPDATLWSFSK